MNNKNQRTKEFLECLGNGKPIYQIESMEDILEEIQNERRLNLKKYYKSVRVCRHCNNEYGDDTRNKRRNKDKCPICMGKSRINSRKQRIESVEEEDD